MVEPNNIKIRISFILYHIFAKFATHCAKFRTKHILQ